MIDWAGLSRSKFYKWVDRYGKANEHNGKIPRDNWIEDWEKQKIINYAETHRGLGYRRIAFRMLDEDVVYVSPSSVYRILSKEGLLQRAPQASLKGTGFKQPTKPHSQWHIDFTHLKIGDRLYHMCIVIDGCSRMILAWTIGEKMTEAEAEITVQKAREKYPDAKPRIISDNGKQFVSKDFKSYLNLWGFGHTRTSPYYPQSNGKLERFNGTIKVECFRKKTPLTLEDARRVADEYITYYNEERLHSAIGYIAPKARMEERHEEIFEARDKKLETAREERRLRRQNAKALA